MFCHLCNVNIKQKIGQRIKELREKNNISQKDLAYAADIDRSYIASVESGKRNISIVNIEKISLAMNITLQEFFNSNLFSE